MNRLVRLTVLLLSSCVAVSFATASASDIQAALLNNKGVKKLNAGEFVPAIQSFKEALKRDPQYSYAIDNLVVALNNQALTLPPERAVWLLRKALLLSPQNETTKCNLAQALKSLDAAHKREAPTEEDRSLLKDIPPESFPAATSVTWPKPQKDVRSASSHVNQGREPANDLQSYLNIMKGLVEARWTPPTAHERLDTEIVVPLSASGKIGSLRLVTPSADPKFDDAALQAIRAASPFDHFPPNSPNKANFLLRFAYIESASGAFYPDLEGTTAGESDYVADVQRRLRTWWHPTKTDQGYSSEVRINIGANGTLDNLKLAKSSGNHAFDDAAFNAVRSASPFQPLPHELGRVAHLRFRFGADIIAMDINSITVPSVDFGYFMETLRKQVKQHWMPPKQSTSCRAVVTFKVRESGGISDLRLSQSSGVAAMDSAALDAISQAAPFELLPIGSPSTVDIQFTFDYNVFLSGPGEHREPPREVPDLQELRGDGIRIFLP